MTKNLLNTREKRNLTFIFVMALFAIVCVLCYFDHEINAQGTTVFAFSYKYGFISRGLLGTIWQFMDKILPIDIMNFDAIYAFTSVITVIYFAVVLWFFYTCLKHCNEKDEKNMRYLASFLAVLAFPMFVTTENFGRTDEYLMILTIICCILIVKEKGEWLVIPLTTICVVMHHGYVFMYLNIILVLFFYKIIMNDDKRKKYIVLFTVTFLIGAFFFLYFEFFSHPEGANAYQEIVALSKKLAQDGKSYSTSMVKHEILGEDVFEYEWKFHLINYASTPVALVMFAPYLIIGISFLIRLFKGKTVKEKWVYFAVAVGSLTTIPQFILKVDYGRYFFAVFFYYIAIVMCLVSMKDKHVIYQLEDSIARVKSKIPAAKLLIAYPMMFMPFLDVQVGTFVWEIVDRYIFK